MESGGIWGACAATSKLSNALRALGSDTRLVISFATDEALAHSNNESHDKFSIYCKLKIIGGFVAKRWERIDQILVLKLYTELPFGKMDSRNVKVKELAALLGRTSGSVAMKLANYASLDETLDRKGLDGATKADRAIWAEFLSDIDGFLAMAVRMQSEQGGDFDYDQPDRLKDHEVREGKTAFRNLEVRTNQNVFRRMVLSAYDEKCGLTGLADTKLLVASHIIPWASNDKTRLDPRNGICLNSLHDKAFDSGLISFRDDLTMLCSPSLKVPTDMNPIFQEGMGLKLKKFQPLPEYLEYHRDTCFKA